MPALLPPFHHCQHQAQELTMEPLLPTPQRRRTPKNPPGRDLTIPLKSVTYVIMQSGLSRRHSLGWSLDDRRYTDLGFFFFFSCLSRLDIFFHSVALVFVLSLLVFPSLPQCQGLKTGEPTSHHPTHAPASLLVIFFLPNSEPTRANGGFPPGSRCRRSARD